MTEGRTEREPAPKPVPSSEGTHDAFADLRMPEFKAAAPGQAGSFVEWQMSRPCSSLLHSMWLLGNSSTVSDKDNPNIYVAPTALSRMTMEDLNNCAENLPPSYKAKKDEKGNLTELSYSRTAPDMMNPLEHPIATIFFGPGILALKAYQGTRDALGITDASVKIKDGHAVLKVPSWYDFIPETKETDNQVKVRLKKQQ